MKKRAVAYLRSSKDEKAVSNDSQYHELREVAERRGFELVGRYEDAVESGKDWDRPGFQELIRAIRNPRRGWTSILVKDTSRIARRRALALIFEEQECAQHGVEVIYANVPDGGDAATVMILRTLLQAMDEWHSLTSREKGLAGMAQNVRNGYRAAGGAPYGYVLEKHAIGPIRNGVPVTKSTLALSDDAPRVQRYLEQRCAGVARMEAARSSGITTKPSSLVGIEWNALTYAGCTTFGVFHERTSTGAYKGQRKRRPRAEWQIQTGTHKALITREQAEAILAALEGSDHGRAISEARQFASKYLLSGLLYTPQGVAWEVNKRTHYWAPRGDGPARYLPIAAVEKGIVEHVVGEIRNAEFARALVALSGGGTQRDRATESKALHKRVAELARTIDRAVTQSLEVDDPAPYQRKIEALERERRGLVEQQWALQEEIKLQAANHAMSVGQMREVLDEFAEQFADADPAAMKQALRSTVERIELDPDTLTCAVHFAIAGRGINPAAMALLRKRPESGVYSQPFQAYRRRLVFRLPYASQRGRYDRGRVRAR